MTLFRATAKVIKSSGKVVPAIVFAFFVCAQINSGKVVPEKRPKKNDYFKWLKVVAEVVA